ncbi:MAG: cation-translocating P-type ATPase [Dehalococcoidia bacterium]|nr:cation-translocating P-type ATPase [Dehalococcoidia bacterium]
MEVSNWHSLSVDEALRALASGRDGLSVEEARKRLTQFGPNELRKEKAVSWWLMLLGQFKNVLIIILLAAAAISLTINLVEEDGNIWDPIIIVVVVMISVVLGFVQQYRAERAMQALKQMIAPTSAVIRAGEESLQPSRELVPGDVIVLRTGDRVAADARLIETASLKMDEAALTGESVAGLKSLEPVRVDLPPAERTNMVFAGTTVAYGKGRAVVTATGMSTEFGKIAGMLQEVEQPKTPLQERLDRFGKMMAGALLAVTALVAILIIVRTDKGLMEIFVWGLSLAIVVVPESLPAIVTVTLAFGVYRMAKKHALIRKLHAVETLGSTTFICSDKTGTLTQNQMMVRKIYVDGLTVEVSGSGYEPKGEFRSAGGTIVPDQHPTLLRVLQIGSMCNDAGLTSDNGAWMIKGDPTEGALIVASAKAGLDMKALAVAWPRVAEIPFSSERMRMTTIHQTPEGRMALCKGAVEVVVNSCNRICIGGRERQLLPDDISAALEANRRMGEEGLRVLALAYKVVPPSAQNPEDIEQDMVLAGLVGMIDPPREEVKEAIGVCQKAGIKAVMITGDHKATAVAVARELGLLRDGLAMSGEELEKLDTAELEDKVEKIEVYARVSPSHKLRVVEALQKRGHVAAMTGDGVNDAPALKRADIGVAMGITGTDVSKEASDMVLTDDNFASIVAAVKEGRHIFGNIKKCLMYLLSCHIGELILMIVAVLVDPRFLPLVAVQLLWLNIAVDGPTALALAFDPPDPDLMEQPPRSRRTSIFTARVIGFIAVAAIWSGLVTFGVFKWALLSGRSEQEAQALCFITLMVVGEFTALASRSERESLFKIGLFKNRWLFLAMVGTIAATLPIVYIPALQDHFRTYSLGWREWAIALLASATLFVVMETFKAVWSRLEERRRRRR